MSDALNGRRILITGAATGIGAAAVRVEQQLKATIPLGGRLGDPDIDLGPMLVFLAGHGSGFGS